MAHHVNKCEPRSTETQSFPSLLISDVVSMKPLDQYKKKKCLLISRDYDGARSYRHYSDSAREIRKQRAQLVLIPGITCKICHVGASRRNCHSLDLRSSVKNQSPTSDNVSNGSEAETSGNKQREGKGR